MRLAQLLAIVAFCPLGVGVGSLGCQPIEQPIGQYRASATRTDATANTTPATFTTPEAASPGETAGLPHVDAGSATEVPLETLDPTSDSLPDPVLPNDSPFDYPTTDTGARPAAAAAPQSCFFTGSQLAKRKRLDMYIVMDANVTLPYGEAWEIATTGVRQFVRDAATQGTGVGLRYYGTECDADPYNVNPTVEVDVLPDNEDKLIEGIDSPTDYYNTSPMAFALEGGVLHQTRRAEAHPDWKQIVVLITDGFTQDLTCRYSLQDVQDVALDGFNSDPSIETYVIGFGAPDTMSTIADELIQRFSVLNGIARDGGGKLFSVKYNDDPKEMHDALTSIRRMAQPCSYEVPQDVDPATLNLMLLGSVVPRVDGAERCGPVLPGFYFTPGTDQPESIELCPGSCRSLQLSDFVALWYSGCPTDRRN